jgi:hypothetical protein
VSSCCCCLHGLACTHLHSGTSSPLVPSRMAPHGSQSVPAAFHNHSSVCPILGRLVRPGKDWPVHVADAGTRPLVPAQQREHKPGMQVTLYAQHVCLCPGPACELCWIRWADLCQQRMARLTAAVLGSTPTWPEPALARCCSGRCRAVDLVRSVWLMVSSRVRSAVCPAVVQQYKTLKSVSSSLLCVHNTKIQPKYRSNVPKEGTVAVLGPPVAGFCCYSFFLPSSDSLVPANAFPRCFLCPV